MKTLIQSIEISSVKEAEEILKAAGTEDLFEKAHFDGEMHPNGKLVWRSSANNGKGDWRVAKKKKDNNEWKIVDDVNNGKKINEIYAKWENIKTDKDFKKWKEEVRENMFGTTKNKTILDIIDNFNPKFKNKIVKKDFLRELKEAYESKPKNLDDVLTKLDKRSKEIYNRMDEEKITKKEKKTTLEKQNIFLVF